MDVLIGKKRSYIYKNIALYNLLTEPQIVLKARGRSIVTCIDAFEILKREISSRYPDWKLKTQIESDSVSMARQEKDEKKGDTINVSELQITISKE